MVFIKASRKACKERDWNRGVKTSKLLKGSKKAFAFGETPFALYLSLCTVLETITFKPALLQRFSDVHSSEYCDRNMYLL